MWAAWAMWPEPCGCGVLARRGLRRGAATAEFSLAELAAAIDDPPQHNVYLEPEGAGGGGGGGVWARGGAARVAVRARLAPAAPQRSLQLEARGAALRLRLAADAAPLQELLLWPDAALLAALAVPHLTPLNITDSKSYVCHKCGAEFEQPNPLKVHLLLGCRPHSALDFWRHCLARLLAPAPLAPLAPPSPAQLELLAAAWGRSRDGHVCVYCGKLYSRKYGLKIHIRTHTGYKPLRCRHCLRAFGDPSNLNKHVRLHAAAATPAARAAHACGLCGAALVRRRDLERHVRARHPALLAPAPSPSLSPPAGAAPAAADERSVGAGGGETGHRTS